MKTKIVIAGIGAVGGYFGGVLAKHYETNKEIEINFLARGNHLHKIQLNGLKVIKGADSFFAHPKIASNNSVEFGLADYIIVACKSYDLENLIEQLKPCINQNTIILPLLNGVDSQSRIQKIFINNLVLAGCVYIVARLQEAGIVENIGNIQTLLFGIDSQTNERLNHLLTIFEEAKIEASLSNNISTILWEKFIFISPTATATSYFNESIGQCLNDGEKLSMIMELIEEVKLIANAHGIKVSDDITQKTLNKLKAMPFEATSSMHSDYKNNKPQTELSSLTGYVVAEGKKFNISTPVYEKMYKELIARL